MVLLFFFNAYDLRYRKWNVPIGRQDVSIGNSSVSFGITFYRLSKSCVRLVLLGTQSAAVVGQGESSLVVTLFPRILCS